MDEQAFRDLERHREDALAAYPPDPHDDDDPGCPYDWADEYGPDYLKET